MPSMTFFGYFGCRIINCLDFVSDVTLKSNTKGSDVEPRLCQEFDEGRSRYSRNEWDLLHMFLF